MSNIKKVLILEDRDEDVELMLFALRQAGLYPQWMRAKNAAQYLEYLEQDPDVILADYFLPQFDAIEALRLMKEHQRDIPFIVVTGTMNEELVVRCMHQGADDYLIKDRLTRLGQAINRALDGRRLKGEIHEKENALHEIDQRFRHLAENAQDIIYRLRVAPELNVEYISPAVEQIVGYAPKEFYENPLLWLNATHPDDVPYFQERVRQKLSSPSRPICLIHRDGSIRWIDIRDNPVLDESGELVAIEGVARDATDRVKAEEALRHSEERMRALLDGIPDIMFLINREGTILECKFPRDEIALRQQLIGKSIKALAELSAIPLDTFVTVDQMTRRTLETRKPEFLEVRFEDRQSQERYFEVRASASGEDEVVLIVRDLTENRQAATVMQRAEMLSQEIQQERELLRLKEDFISMVSHEFRTPLAVIFSAIEILELHYDRLSPEKRMERVKKIKAQAVYMNDLLNDVLFISRARAGKMEFSPRSMDLLSFCQNAVEQVKLRSAYRDHQIAFRYDTDVSIVSMDEKLLHHIIINLLENAVKYSPPASEVIFEVRTEGDNAIFKVADHGIGIPMESAQHLFEPFYRASNVEKIGGTGLGLSIVKNSATVHQGTITYESEPNKGTTFTVKLPCRLKRTY